MARPSADAVFDTNILIDYLIGRDEARRELDRYPRRAISMITWRALQAGSQNPGEAAVVELFLREFRVIDITRQVARRAFEIRKHTGVRLPDAIIWATAQLESAVVVTRNTRDFPADDPGVRIPY